MRRARLILAAFLGVLSIAAASDPAERLPDPAQEARAKALFSGVRCMVCQNESIDDSDAELAGDLRRLVREQVAAGRSDQEIKTYLVDRYGEFVLMKPAFSLGNLALWGLPFVVVALGVFLLARRLRPARAEAPAEGDLSPAEEARLKALTQDRKD